MGNFILIISYFVFAVLGSTLIKMGSMEYVKYFILIPFINFKFSLISILGIFFYGLSFVIYMILLSRFDLSFISPLTVGVVYVLLMITSFVVFKEEFTASKVVGSILIFIGVLVMSLTK